MKKVCMLVTMLIAVNCCCAGVLYEDDFNRDDGDAVGSTVSSGTYVWSEWYTAGATGIIDNNAMVLTATTTGMQSNFWVNCNLDTIENYTVSFDLSAQGSTNYIRAYIRARDTYTKDWDTDCYRLNASSSAGTVTGAIFEGSTPTSLGTLFDVGETVHVSILVEGNASTLTIGDTTYDTYATGGTYNDGTADYFIFGIYSDSADMTYTMDNLVVTQVPEPATICLLALGSLSTLFRRKKWR